MSSKTSMDLNNISEEELLNTRISDLPLKIEGTWLEECVKELHKELEDKGIAFKPECYLADEWLTPEKETCIGIPFYLAHPTLIRLERKFMMDAEGETKPWCMKLLRHEAGHTITYAYRFHKRKAWQKIFGPSSLEYKDTYKYHPYSKNYVRHLDGYYAQYHPDEDFVETFAVWLTPNLDWRAQYKGWKACQKLNYVDRLMQEIKGKPAVNQSRVKFWRLSTLKMTLRNYYKKKRHLLAEDLPDFHDKFIKKNFVERTKENSQYPFVKAAIQKYHNDIINTISRQTGERKYVIGDVLKSIGQRSKELNLVVALDEPVLMLKLSAYISTLVMNYLYTGRFRGEKRNKKIK